MIMKYLTRLANLTIILVLLQAAFFVALIYELQRLYFPVSVALVALSAVCALFIATSDNHPIFRLSWAVAIMILPIFGGVIYIFYDRRKMARLIENKHAACFRAALKERSREPYINTLFEQDRAAYRTAAYLYNAVGFTPAAANDCKYFPVGEDKLAYLISEMKKAEKYIFLEYFIIEEGIVWDMVYEVLEEKAREGVDVRIIYDGAGCMYPLPLRFCRKMARAGIKVKVFNPVRPFLSVRINVRNHRKIAVIDGKKAFCGGLNLADQYVNLKEMYGHWKDSAIMADGGAAWDLTLMFLSMWEFLSGEKTDYAAFKPDGYPPAKTSGVPEKQYAVPMFDIPHDKVTVSEHTFISFISGARDYIYITTPYLMCGNEILSALYVAARSGVDVRIITPYVADKKLVKAVTESYYRGLIENSVRVFEYTPGFIHAKNVIADGRRAMVGTVNLDYRSLYLHYECGVCFFGGGVVEEVSRDFAETLQQCREVTLSDLNRESFFKKGIKRASRLFAPFL